jgi:hypothetical protein
LRLVDLLRGAIAGYVLKAVQTLAALAVLPFLVDDRVLGLEGYGRAFSLLSATVVMSVFTDGFKVALSRSIAQGINRGDGSAGQALGGGTRLLAASSLVVAAILFVYRDALLEAMGLPIDTAHRTAFAAAASMIVIAESGHGVLALLLVRGRLDLVNTIQAIEVIARNAFFVVYYQHHEATVANFVGAFAVGALLRTSAYFVYAGSRLRADFTGAGRGRMRDVIPVLGYSVSVSLATIYYFFFFRLSVPAVNAVLGGQAAGSLALTLSIADTYLRGALLSVVEPAVVPMAARLRVEDLRGRIRISIERVESLLRGACWVATAALAAGAPFAIDLWLGRELMSIALGTQIMIAAIGVQLSLTVKRSLAIGLGSAAELAIVATPVGVLAFVGVVVSAWYFRSVDGVVLSIAAFCAVSDAVGATRAYAALFGEKDPVAPVRTLLLAAVVYVPAVVLGAVCALHGFLVVAAAIVASTLWAAGIVHCYVLPIRECLRTLKQLRRNASRDLFPSAG